MKKLIFLLLLLPLVVVGQTRQYTFDNVPNKWSHDNAVIREFSITDSLDLYFTQSKSRDKLQRLKLYSMGDDGPNFFLYFNMGHHYSKTKKSVIVAWLLNDTTAWCDLYTLNGDRWVRSNKEEHLQIDRFSPAYFHATVADYNFDGFPDIYLNFYQSMGVVYGYGYLLTFDPETQSMVLHPESIHIANMETDTKNKCIYSVIYANPNAELENYKMIHKYKWINGALELVSHKKIILPKAR